MYYVYMHCTFFQHEVNAITVCQAFIMNSDGRREARLRKRERRAAESSVEREMRLARRRVATGVPRNHLVFSADLRVI